MDSIPSASNKTARRKSAQLRVRLSHAELEAFEQKRKQDWQAGHAYAETLSSWVRHQIQSFVCPDPDKERSLISRELYTKVEELARLLDKTPEAVIEECITGIVNRIHHSQAQYPLIIAEWRLRQQYSRSRVAVSDKLSTISTLSRKPLA